MNDLNIMVKAPSIKIKVPNIMLNALSITIKPPSIMIEAPNIIIEAPSIMMEEPNIMVNRGERFARWKTNSCYKYDGTLSKKLL